MNFSAEVIQQVWEKARVMAERDADEWRHDQCGAWIKRDAYQYKHSDYGWRICAVGPSDSGALENLRPFHHQNDFNVASGKPRCHVSADRTGLQPNASVDHPQNKLM